MAAMKNQYYLPAIIASLMLAPNGVVAQEFDDANYINCMEQAQGDDPDKGLFTALKMRGKSLDIPARHCESTALYSLGEYEEAAERLEGMLTDMRIGIGMPKVAGARRSASKAMLGQIIKMAAESWILAREGNRAYYIASQGVNLYDSGDERLYVYYILRGDGLMLEKDFDAAIKDFKEATKLKEDATAAWGSLARAERMAGDMVEAEKALQQAMLFGENNVAVRLEAGAIAYLVGDHESARKHWLWVALHAENEEATLTAQSRLQALELGLELED